MIGVAALAVAVSCVHASPNLAAAPALTLKDLQNFTYDLGASSSVEDGKVRLANGQWQDEKGGSRFLLLPVHAIADLDLDGSADAVAVLVEGSVGTGSFYYMFALMNRDGKPVQMGPPEWLGDRSVIQRVSVDRKGIITVRFVTHRDSDPACCPTLRIEDRFRVQDGKLIGITR
jgi:hypothetical protein